MLKRLIRAARSNLGKWRAMASSDGDFIQQPRKGFRIDYLPGLGGPVGLSEQTALATSAVAACVKLISGSLARLDFGVYQKRDAHRERVPDHPADSVLRDPAAGFARHEWAEILFNRLVLTGNAFIRVARSQGEPYALYPCEGEGYEQGPRGLSLRLREYRAPGVPAVDMTVRPRDAIHLHTEFMDVETGRSLSPVQMAAGRAAKVSTASLKALTTSMQDGFRAPGVLTTPFEMGSDELVSFLKAFGEPAPAGALPSLPAGVEYKGIQLPAIDAAIIAVLEWSVDEVCRAYGVPKPLINSVDGKYNAQLDLHWESFIRTTLQRYIASVQSSLGYRLLTRRERKGGLCIYADPLELQLPVLPELVRMVKDIAQTGAVSKGEARRMLAPFNLPPTDNDDDELRVTGAPEPRENTQED